MVEDNGGSTKPSYPAKQYLVRSAAVGLAGLLVLAGFLLASHFKHPGVASPRQHYFPAAIRSSTKFQLYYPAQLPSGLSVVVDSIKASKQTVFYNVQDTAGHKFYVSLQAYPANFDYEAFKQKFSNTDEFNTTVGNVLYGDAGYALVASIRTNDNSWILINAPDTSTGSELQAITRSFVKAN